MYTDYIGRMWWVWCWCHLCFIASPWRGIVAVDMWPLVPSVSQHINRRCTLPPYTIGRSKRIVSMQRIDDQWARSSTSQQGQTTTTHDCSGGFFVDNHVKVDWVVPDGSETHKSVNLLVRPKLTSERTPGQKRGVISSVVENFWRIGEDQRKERIQEEKLHNESSREALMMLSLELASVPFLSTLSYVFTRAFKQLCHTHTHTHKNWRERKRPQPTISQPELPTKKA